VSYQTLARGRQPATFFPLEDSMSGVSAGIVAGADIYSQPAAQSSFSASLTNPGTWSYIWVGAALLYLVGIYIGAIRIAGRGGSE
jgi:hypothetical protein